MPTFEEFFKVTSLDIWWKYERDFLIAIEWNDKGEWTIPEWYYDLITNPMLVGVEA